MTDKILKTRLRLKYDTLANWSAANPVLLEGEVGIVSIPLASETTVGQIVKPAILFKVGDGTTSFGTLPWASAMAADVHAWAKKASLEYADLPGELRNEVDALQALTAGELKFGETTYNSLKEYVDAKTAGIATDAALGDLQNKVSALETALESYATTTYVDEKVLEINGTITDLTNRVAAIEADYIDTAKLNTALADKITMSDVEEKGYITAADVEKYDDTEVKGLITAETTRATEAENALDARIDTLEAYDHTTYATKSEVETVASDLTDANTKLDAEIEARIAADETHTSNIKTNTDAIAVLNGNTSVEGSVDKKVADAINTFATQISDDETVNTYKELIDYAASHGSEFTELVGEVDTNTKAIQTLNGDVNIAGSINKKIADAIGAENLSQYETTTNANLKLTEAKEYADSLAGNYATAAQGEKANTAIQDITTTANEGLKISKTETSVNIDIDDTVIFTFYGGTATDLI